MRNTGKFFRTWKKKIYIQCCKLIFISYCRDFIQFVFHCALLKVFLKFNTLWMTMFYETDFYLLYKVILYTFGIFGRLFFFDKKFVFYNEFIKIIGSFNSILKKRRCLPNLVEMGLKMLWTTFLCVIHKLTELSQL